MPSGLSQFAGQHWVVGGILTSLLWSVAGKQSHSNRKADLAMLWQGVGILVVLVLCGWAIVDREWIGLGVAIVVLCIEVRLIKKIWSTARSSQR